MNTNRETFHWEHCAEKKDRPKAIVDIKRNGFLFGYVHFDVIYM